MSARIVISEFMDAAAVARLEAAADVTYDPTLVDDPARLTDLLGAADALIVRNRTQVRGDLLAAGAKLRVVGRLGVGLDNIDGAACADRGIAVIPATGANAVAVAEYVIASALLLVRGAAYRSTDAVLDGSWPRQACVGGEVMGRTLALVGFGGIAREVAVRAKAFGMHLVATDPLLPADDPAWAAFGVERLSFAELLPRADILSLHVPLVAETRNLIDAGAIAAMPAGAVVINSARGGVVDEAALASALASGHLGGAALDVFEGEPLAAGSPLAGAPNLLATPHIAGVTGESNVRVSHMIADKVLEALA